jgi:hypothetical protein
VFLEGPDLRGQGPGQQPLLVALEEFLVAQGGAFQVALLGEGTGSTQQLLLAVGDLARGGGR